MDVCFILMKYVVNNVWNTKCTVELLIPHAPALIASWHYFTRQTDNLYICSRNIWLVCLLVPLFLCASSLSPSSLHSQKERKAAGLLKLLSGAAAKKKPRSPPSSPPTHDPSMPVQGAVATDPTHHPHYHHHHARSGSCPMASQGRAGSCPIESEMAGAIGLEPLHRKSGSLDTNFPMSPPAPRAGNPLMVLRPEPKPLSRERWTHTHTHIRHR